MERTGAFLGVGRGFEQALQRVRAAESLGYESVWVTQTLERDALLVLGEYARATARVRLGTGVVPIFGRAPAVLAQQAATLAELCGGRFVLGVGVSHAPLVEGILGLPYERPLEAMREYLTILRGILRDGHAAFQGKRFRTSFGFMGWTPPLPVPVYLAALSPRMCRLAGELADGVVLWCCTPDYIRDHVAPNVRAGAEAAGRDPASVEIVAAVPASATEDPQGAREALRRELFVYWTLPNYRAAIERAGYGEGIRAFDEALGSGGPKEASAAIPAGFVDALGAFGDAPAIRAKLQAYRAAGAVPAVGPFSGHEGARGALATLEAAAPAGGPGGG